MDIVSDPMDIDSPPRPRLTSGKKLTGNILTAVSDTC